MTIQLEMISTTFEKPRYSLGKKNALFRPVKSEPRGASNIARELCDLRTRDIWTKGHPDHPVDWADEKVWQKIRDEGRYHKSEELMVSCGTIGQQSLRISGVKNTVQGTGTKTKIPGSLNALAMRLLGSANDPDPATGAWRHIYWFAAKPRLGITRDNSHMPTQDREKFSTFWFSEKEALAKLKLDDEKFSDPRADRGWKRSMPDMCKFMQTSLYAPPGSDALTGFNIVY
ncbi:NUDIX hydrolase domain-like protein [Xylariaceae sp. FL0804]|nr:NUDIX hydrolase domain-like protein [Xylariaceae sp. FL0804]